MIAGVTVYPAGPGRAIYIGSNESLYVPDFAMPADAVTIEMWTRPLQVWLSLCFVVFGAE